MREIKKTPMKFAIAVTALLLFQSMVVLAQPRVSLTLYKPETSIAQLNIDSLTGEEPVSVTVKDEQGTILYRSQSKAADYTKLIDFAKIQDGRYFIDVTHPVAIIRKVVTKKDNGLSIEQDSYYVHNRLSLLEKGDKKLLVNLNKNLNAPITLRITDSEGHILHEATDIKSNNYSVIYNLSKLTSGVYNMSLVSDNFSNTRSFKVD